MKLIADCFIWSERKLHWRHFAFHSAHRLVDGISYIIILDGLYKDMQVVHHVTTSE